MDIYYAEREELVKMSNLNKTPTQIFTQALPQFDSVNKIETVSRSLNVFQSLLQ